VVNLTRLGVDEVRPLKRAEYDRLVELGAFEDEKIELLRGMLVPMSPQDYEHGDIITRLNMLLAPALVGKALVRVQLPLAVSNDSEPEPDIAVVAEPGRRSHPTKALLVIEVSGSTLRKDRGLKRELYAESGVPEYWIIDVAKKTIEVHTGPSKQGYRRVVTHRSGAVITPVKLRGLKIKVAQVLSAGTH
jgi:Uma2 family endonuclease